MAGVSGDPSHHGTMERVAHIFPHERLEEPGCPGSSWYLIRKEIEENSPSRRDGIDLKKETYLCKSYCTYLQDLGMRLKVPQVTIATAIIFCHRFFLRQSHAKNDRRTIATVCMFLAGKVEETPRPLKDVIIVSYEIIHKKDTAAAQRIKQRDVYEQQKELILLGERVLLATLGFDFNVHHPYKPLVEAIKRFKVAQNALAQVAWNFVNDGLRTSLCLQFKPHHIAAGAIFLAAKFLKVKLPSDGEKSWWQEFDVTPRQLEEVSNQMLELYEQNRATPSSHGNETEENSGVSNQPPAKNSAVPEESTSQNGHSHAAVATGGKQQVITASSWPVPPAPQLVTDYSHTEKQNGPQKFTQDEGNGHGAKESRVAVWDQKLDAGIKDHRYHELASVAEASDGKPNYGSKRPLEDKRRSDTGGASEAKQWNSGYGDVPKDYSPVDAIKKIDKDRVKAAFEKRKKSRTDVARKMDLVGEDDLIERELENGVELAAEDEKIKHERRQNWPKALNRPEPLNSDPGLEHGNIGTELDTENVEEGELPSNSREFRSPKAGSRKRKAESPHKLLQEKEGRDFPRHHIPYTKDRDAMEGGSMIGRHDHGERDHKRHG